MVKWTGQTQKSNTEIFMNKEGQKFEIPEFSVSPEMYFRSIPILVGVNSSLN